MIADALLAQTGIHRRQRQFYRNPHAIADAGGRGAGAAAESVNGQNIRPAPGNAAGNGGNVVDRCDFYDHGLFVAGGLFQGIDQLTQVLDGVNVMVGSGGDSIGPLRDHPGPGHVAYDFRSRQMAADAGLGPLAHFDLNGRTGVEIAFMDAEPAGGHLDDGIFPVAIKILVKAALTGQSCVGVVADGTVTHGGEKDRHGKLQLGRQGGIQGPVRQTADVVRPFSQKHTGLHRLPERVNGWIRHLRSVD